MTSFGGDDVAAEITSERLPSRAGRDDLAPGWINDDGLGDMNGAAYVSVDGASELVPAELRGRIESALALPGTAPALADLVRGLLVTPQIRPGASTRARRGRLNSLKMRRVIGWGSGNYELPMTVALERMVNCHGYFPQPKLFRIPARRTDGSPYSYGHRPDALALFVVTDETSGDDRLRPTFIETKPEQELRKLIDRYVRDPQRGWAHPAAATFFLETYGAAYEVWTPANLNPVVIENWRILAPYLDHVLTLSVDLRQRVAATLRRHPGIDMRALRERLPDLSADHGFALIADGTIVFPIDRESLAHPERLHLFADALLAEAAMALPTRALPGVTKELDLVEGIRLQWGDREYVVANATARLVTLQVLLPEGGSKLLPPIEREELEKLGARGDLAQLDPPHDSVAAALDGLVSVAEQQITTARLAVAWRLQTEKPKSRQERRIARLVREAAHSGIPVARALRAQVRLRGWRGKRLPDATEELRDLNRKLIAAAVDKYRTKAAPSGQAAYRGYTHTTKGTGVKPVALSTFQHYLAEPTQESTTRLREGERAAIAVAPSGRHHSAYRVTPPHALFAVGLDHTKIAMEVVAIRASRRISLGRPWLTLMADPYSTKVFDPVLLFDAPSRATLQLAVRAFVAENGVLPLGWAHDNGPEFGSEFWELLNKAQHCEIYQRPASNPRHGSDTELKFNSLDRFLFHNVLGGTKAMRDVRRVSGSHLPSRNAISTLEDVYTFVSAWKDAHNSTPIHGLGLTPNEIHEQSLREHGVRSQRTVAFDNAFRALTMARTDHVLVDGGFVEVSGVRYSAALLSALSNRTRVTVRWDPYLRSRASVWVAGEWHELRVQERYEDLASLSERERRWASLEITEMLSRRPDREEFAALLDQVQTHQANSLDSLRSAEQKALLGDNTPDPATDADDVLPDVAMDDIEEEAPAW
jgi:putative transposase